MSQIEKGLVPNLLGDYHFYTMIYKEFVLKITAKHVYKNWKISTIVSKRHQAKSFV